MAKPPRLSMIGLVRELTRASLLAAVWKPTIAFSCLARMKFSSVKALTMRIPCAVSCSDSIICSAPWNSLAMILRHHDDDEPDDRQHVAGKGGDEEIEHAARGLGDERLASDEFGRMRAGIVAHLHPQHLVEDAPLHVGDDAVADPRHGDLLAIG